MTHLKLNLLGHPQVWMADKEIADFHSNKARALLYYLVTSGRTHARAVLSSLFWGGYPESSANNNLRRTLSNLRRLIGDHLLITRDSVTFDETSDYWLDVLAFEHEAAKLQSAGDLRAGEFALETYGGDFLEGFYVNDAPEWESWMFSERLRLREKHRAVMYKLAELYAERAEFNRAIALARELVSLESLWEDAHRLLMRLYAQNKQRVRALDQYERLCELLNEELDVKPTAETQSLFEDIRSGGFESEPEIYLDYDEVPLSQAIHQPPSFLDNEDGLSGARESVFVGREAQLDQLNRYLDRAIAGQGQVVFVIGEAGRGKTALLTEFARRAQERHTDLIVASGNCNAFLGTGDPFHPFRDILELLSGEVESRWRMGAITTEQAKRLWGLIPETALAVATQGKSLIDRLVSGTALLERASSYTTENISWLTRLRAVVEESEKRHLEQGQLMAEFTAVLKELARRHPLLLILDDLQWADNSSLDLLFHLTRHLSGQPIFVVGAYRPSEITPVRPADQEASSTLSLSSLVAELKRRFGQTEIDLGHISSAAQRQFTDALIDREPNRLGDSFRSAFYQRTKGHPLFSIEMLREMQDRGDLVQDEEGVWEAAQELDWERLPARVEAVISQRINRLNHELRGILAAASVEGEGFTAQAVARVLERDERWVLHQLSHLQREHRLVHELAEINLAGRQLTRFQFNHILFQEYLYHDLNQGERRLLHRAIAAALEDLYAGHKDVLRVSLAHHYTEAGQPEEATPYLLSAGDQARTQNAFREALDHYRRALAFLKKKGLYEEAAQTLMKIGLTHHNASAFDQARTANEEAFRLWQQVARSAVGGSLPQAPHALRVAGENFSGKLDPAMVKETPRALLMQQLFSGLMRLGQDLDLLPDLAYGWEVLDHGRRYLFHLTREANWSDGVPVTAGDLEFAWKRVLDPATGSPSAIDLFDIKGARSFHLGKGSPDAVGIRALDDVTLQVELDGVSPYFPNILFFESTKPVPRHAVEKHGSAWMEPDKIVTNGPFRLVSYTPGELMVMARNQDYHGSFTGNVEQVEIHLGLRADRLRHMDMYVAGELDVLYTFTHLPPETQRRLREELVSEYRSGPTLATWLVGFVLDQPPFDDRRVRRAFAMVTDRHMLANVVHCGLVSPATGGFLSPVHAAYSEGIALPYDPDQARRLLAEAGYPGGRGLPTIKMVNGHASLSVEASLRQLQTQWRQHLGVNMVWETIWEMGAFLRRLRRDPAHLFFMRWVGKHTDPDDFLHLESSLIWEIARWHDEDYFTLVNEARMLADWGERMALYQQADRKLIEEAVLLPLVYDRSHFLVKPWVRRFAYAAIPRWFFSDVILEPH